MLRLKQRESIPNGFWVEVPEIKFKQQFWDFESAVKSLHQTLRANPGITLRYPHLPKGEQACANFVDAQNAQRVAKMRGAQSYVQEGGPAPQIPFEVRTTARPGVVPPAANAGKPPAWFRRIQSGVATIADWLGDAGVPVANDLAEKRAGVCAGCPQNRKGDLFSFFTQPAVNLLKRQLAERQQMKLSTTRDKELGVCNACGCALHLKVHVPLETILKHMGGAEQAALDANCWIKKGQ